MNQTHGYILKSSKDSILIRNSDYCIEHITDSRLIKHLFAQVEPAVNTYKQIKVQCFYVSKAINLFLG